MTDEKLCGLNFYEGETFQIYTTELNTGELWPVDVVIAMKKIPCILPIMNWSESELHLRAPVMGKWNTSGGVL